MWYQRAKRISDLVGTARYCSIRSHLGLQLSRRDDLESIGYVLVYLAAPGLPWQGLKANSNREKVSLCRVRRVLLCGPWY